MRALRVFESISIDGYFTDANGDMSWAHRGNDDSEFASFVAENAGSESELLFGRKTYEMMMAYWQTPLAAQQLPEVASGMNGARKYVASRTLERAGWTNSRLLKGDLVRAVSDLKSRAGPPIVVLGSGTVAAHLGAARLVDEYQFVVVPIALGSGRTVFAARSDLRLTEQRTFRNGSVVVTYAV